MPSNDFTRRCYTALWVCVEVLRLDICELEPLERWYVEHPYARCCETRLIVDIAGGLLDAAGDDDLVAGVVGGAGDGSAKFATGRRTFVVVWGGGVSIGKVLLEPFEVLVAPDVDRSHVCLFEG